MESLISRIFPPNPVMVDRWTDLGKRIWNERLSSYGTKPLPDCLGIYNEDVSESVLSRASSELEHTHKIPVRFRTAKQLHNEQQEFAMRGLGTSRFFLCDEWPRVRCCFTRCPSKQELIDTMLLQQPPSVTTDRGGATEDPSVSPSFRKWIRIFITETTVDVGKMFLNHKGFVQKGLPEKEYEIKIINSDDDDDLLFSGGRQDWIGIQERYF